MGAKRNEELVDRVEEEEPEALDDDEDDITIADEEEENEQASLEELLAARASARKSAADSDEDADILSFSSEQDEPVVEVLPTRVSPIRERQEFVCSNCYLVKPRVQLADADKRLCRDCA